MRCYYALQQLPRRVSLSGESRRGFFQDFAVDFGRLVGPAALLVGNSEIESRFIQVRVALKRAFEERHRVSRSTGLH